MKKIILANTLFLFTLWLTLPGICRADAQTVLEAINTTLGQQVSYATTGINGLYTNQWHNTYSMSLEGNLLHVAFTEDITFYKQGHFQDRYVETGTYTLDLTKTDSTLVTTKANKERIEITCSNGADCVTKTFSGVFYAAGQVEKNSRQGSTSTNALGIFLDPAHFPADLVDQLKLLISQVKGR